MRTLSNAFGYFNLKISKYHRPPITTETEHIKMIRISCPLAVLILPLKNSSDSK